MPSARILRAWGAAAACVIAIAGAGGACDDAGAGASRQASSAGSEQAAAPQARSTAAEPKREEPAAAEPGEPSQPLGPRGTVHLVVLERFPDDLLDAIESELRQELDVEVVRDGTVPLPERAYYPPRKRYRAEKLLDFLRPRLADAPERERVLGLASVDISTTKGPHRDWGIFGLGDRPGRAAVISMFRLRRGARDRDHLRFRMATTAVHEIGHTYGLPHCEDPRCIMNDAEGSIETVDRSTGELGPRCLQRLKHYAPRPRD